MEEVAKNIYRLTTPYKDIYTTVIVIKTPLGAVLFDTATYREDVENVILPALEKLEIHGDDLKCIVLSHSHGDHAGGLQWVAEAFPNARILSRNPALKEKYGDVFQYPEDGEVILDTLQILAVPGHSADSLCLLDTVTGTLISGDSLQLYGIYGSGTWGSSVRLLAEHLEAVEKLRKLDFQAIIASHDYHPYGYHAQGAEAVQKYLNTCREALYRILDFIRSRKEMDADELAMIYNSQSGLPTVNPQVIKAIQTAADSGRM